MTERAKPVRAKVAKQKVASLRGRTGSDHLYDGKKESGGIGLYGKRINRLGRRPDTN